MQLQITYNDNLVAKCLLAWIGFHMYPLDTYLLIFIDWIQVLVLHWKIE